MAPATDATPIRRSLDPEVGRASLWSRLRMGLAMRLSYGRYATSELWNRAVNTNNVTLAQKLLEHGFVPARPKKGETWDPMGDMLFTAIRFRDGKMVECLLKAGANPDHMEHNNYWDGIAHRAARYGNLAAIEALIAHGVNLNLRDGNKFTPMLAALDDFGRKAETDVEVRWAIVDALAAAGADVKIQNSHAEDLLTYALTDTPERLSWALSLGLTLPNPQEALFSVLYSGLEQLGEPSASFYRCSGLARDRYTENKDYRWDRWGMVDILINQGASFAGFDGEGRSLFERGIETGDLRAADVAEFVRRGAPLDVRDAVGNTLTHRLMTKRSYANDTGLVLYDAFRAAGLPDQLNVVNAAGQTPVQALEARVLDWYVREANAFRDHVKTIAPPPVQPSARLDLTKSSEGKPASVVSGLRQRFRRTPPSGVSS